jgi:hypothetical protein
VPANIYRPAVASAESFRVALGSASRVAAFLAAAHLFVGASAMLARAAVLILHRCVSPLPAGRRPPPHDPVARPGVRRAPSWKQQASRRILSVLRSSDLIRGIVRWRRHQPRRRRVSRGMQKSARSGPIPHGTLRCRAPMISPRVMRHSALARLRPPIAQIGKAYTLPAGFWCCANSALLRCSQ